ncbi:hypothetical protein IF599_004794 [Salmonella enterica]|nr:hypothetical protein [Salmonella enterica]
MKNIPFGQFWCVDGTYFENMPQHGNVSIMHYARVIGWEQYEGTCAPVQAWHCAGISSDNNPNTSRNISADMLRAEDLPPEFNEIDKGDAVFSVFIALVYSAETGAFIGYFKNNNLDWGDFIPVNNSREKIKTHDDLKLFAENGDLPE